MVLQQYEERQQQINSTMVLRQFWQDIMKYINDIRNSYVDINSLPQQVDHSSENDLRITVINTFKTPLKIQYYLWIWVIYSFYALLKMIVLLPVQLLVGILNSTLTILQISFSTYTTFFSVITLMASYVFQQQQYDLLDPSYMYHVFRGQAALKLYGLMFAIEIAQKILTMVGKYLYTNIKQKLEDPYMVQEFIHLVPEMFVTLLYTCVHAYVLFLEYNIYIVVINTSVPNFIIFVFVINLTKMKSVAMKKSDTKTYQSQINLDAKQRLQKTLYLILFQLSQRNRTIIDIQFKLVFIFIVGAVIEHMKHMTVLRLSPQIGEIDKICNKTFYNFYISSDYRTFIKCMNNDFTVIPFVVYFVKMIGIILYSDEQITQISNEKAVNMYIFLCGLTLFVKIIMLLIRKSNFLNCPSQIEGESMVSSKVIEAKKKDSSSVVSMKEDDDKVSVKSEKGKQMRAKSQKAVRYSRSKEQ